MGQKEFKTAVSYCLRAYKILVHRLGADHPRTKTVSENMKFAYNAWNPQGDFERWLEENMRE